MAMATKTTMNVKKAMTDQSMLWGYNVSFWDVWGLRLMFIGAALGAVALGLSLASSFVLYKVADKVQSESDQKIAEANARAEGARSEAAKANERTASFEKAAELARLETERLKKEFSWRDITPSQDAIIGIAPAFVEICLAGLTG
jgi:hypothetical protein